MFWRRGRISRFVLGCDNLNTLAEGTIVWDAWIEAGGTTFDTAFVYGSGTHKKLLGDWIAARGVADQVAMIGKGARTPYSVPDAIEAQLDLSLDRLSLASVPIYILHRDNPDVSVDEFVDALNRLRAKGKIGVFGASNWSIARFAAANAYAARTGQESFRILNNNLSLAVMERPIWTGCMSSNTPDALEFLAQTGTIHLSWSAQARGYFLPAALRDRLPPAIGPEACFGSDKNAELRDRAETLARKHGITAHNIAAAWELSQPFPSLALIGPRSPGEIALSIAALAVNISRKEADWLNLDVALP